MVPLFSKGTGERHFLVPPQVPAPVGRMVRKSRYDACLTPTACRSISSPSGPTSSVLYLTACWPRPVTFQRATSLPTLRKVGRKEQLVFAFFINPIGASAINPGTQNLGPIHPHHPSSRGAFTLTSVASSTGPALPNWILPETPVAVAGFQRPQVNSVRDHRDGTSSSRRESSTGIDCETHCQPVPIRVRKQTSN